MKKLAVLVSEHQDAAAAFKAQGWKVFSVDDLAAQSQHPPRLFSPSQSPGGEGVPSGFGWFYISEY